MKHYRRVTFFTAFFFSVIATAEPQAPKNFAFQYCEKEKELLCKDKNNVSDIASCLLSQSEKLSTECKQEIERFILFKKQASARGGGALSGFGGLNAMGPPIPLVSYEGRFSPGENSPAFIENKANISTPVYRTETDTLSLSLAGGLVHLNRTIALDSGANVPTDLCRLELGAQFYHQLADKKNWGLRASLGYAGDEPFKNASDATYSLMGNYGFPDSGNGRWIFSLFFSNNSPIGNYIPIPGVGYIYKSETFSGIFGLPFASVQWTPVFPWSFSLSLFGPTIQTEVGYGSIESWQLFAGYYWLRQSYIPNVRNEDRDRLNIQEMKTVVGIRSPLWEGTLSELQAGRVFNRSINVGKSLFNQDGGSASVEGDWVVTWSIKVRL